MTFKLLQLNIDFFKFFTMIKSVQQFHEILWNAVLGLYFLKLNIKEVIQISAIYAVTIGLDYLSEHAKYIILISSQKNYTSQKMTIAYAKFLKSMLKQINSRIKQIV